MSAERRPSFSDIVLELEAINKDDEEKPAALGKADLYISKENTSQVVRQSRVVLLNFFKWI